MPAPQGSHEVSGKLCCHFVQKSNFAVLTANDKFDLNMIASIPCYLLLIEFCRVLVLEPDIIQTRMKGTFDKNQGFSHFQGKINHKILF